MASTQDPPAPAPAALSAEERAFFAERGWLRVRGAVPPARVAALERALDAVVPPGLYGWGYEGKVVEVAGISQGSAALLAHARDAGLAGLAAQALGVRRVQLLQDTVFIKPAREGGGVAWHQDYSYFAFLSPPRGVTLRLALTPCTGESGCLRVIEGSHRWGLQTQDLSFRATAVEDALSGLPAALRERAAAAEREVELAPGDLSLHHCLTFHGSGPNRSAGPRKTLAVRLVDAACAVDPSRLATPEARARVPTDGEGRLSPAVFFRFGGEG